MAHFKHIYYLLMQFRLVYRLINMAFPTKIKIVIMQTINMSSAIAFVSHLNFSLFDL